MEQSSILSLDDVPLFFFFFATHAKAAAAAVVTRLERGLGGARRRYPFYESFHLLTIDHACMRPFRRRDCFAPDLLRCHRNFSPEKETSSCFVVPIFRAGGLVTWFMFPSFNFGHLINVCLSNLAVDHGQKKAPSPFRDGQPFNTPSNIAVTGPPSFCAFLIHTYIRYVPYDCS